MRSSTTERGIEPSQLNMRPTAGPSSGWPANPTKKPPQKPRNKLNSIPNTVPRHAKLHHMANTLSQVISRNSVCLGVVGTANPAECWGECGAGSGNAGTTGRSSGNEYPQSHLRTALVNNSL